MAKDVQTTKVAIIGAGIAGLYCGYRLQQEGKPDFLIAEASQHVGGRIWTTRLLESDPNSTDQVWADDGAQLEKDPDAPKDGKKHFKVDGRRVEFCAEFGPMRIELDLQEYLHGLLICLGLDKDLEPFPAYQSPTSDHDPKYELSREEQEQETPLDLLQLAILRVLGKLTSSDTLLQEKLDDLTKDLSRVSATRQDSWKPVFQRWVENLREPDYQKLREYGRFDDGTKDGTTEGTFLWNMGFWNLLSDVLSHHALLKLRDLGTFYHLIPENPNAAEWLIFWLRGFRTSNQLVGIHGGMQRITEELEMAIDPQGAAKKVLRGLKLLGIARADDGKNVKLTFDTGEIWIAEHVILALPREPLQELALRNKTLYPNLHRDLSSVFGFPLVKVFLGVKQRWWSEHRTMANRFATQMPTRELHYWPSSMSQRGLTMIYTDRPASTFWTNYIRHTEKDKIPSGAQVTPECGKAGDNPRLIRKVLQYIASAGIRRTEKDIDFYGIRDWGREPYSGAAHSWLPERKSWEFLRKLCAFGIGEDGESAPEDKRVLHICGEAYSDYQAFIEGALRSAEHVLHAIEPKSFPETPTPWLCMHGVEAHPSGPKPPDCFAKVLNPQGKITSK